MGRICLTKKNFVDLGGYDEHFDARSEDCDLLWRAGKKGLEYIRVDNKKWAKSLYHDNSIRYNMHKVKDGSASERKAYEMIMNNYTNNIIVANPDGWGKAIVYKNFSSIPVDLK
jgi:GT2 family glycosyltransferase